MQRVPVLGEPHVLSMILAGGEGRRLLPLTADRAKPAVPFGGRYRIIDIVLSNFVNSGLTRIKVLTQYKSASLEEHIARARRLSAITDDYMKKMREIPGAVDSSAPPTIPSSRGASTPRASSRPRRRSPAPSAC